MPVYSKAGIRRLALWDAADTPDDILSLFNRGNGTFSIIEKDSVRDYRNRVKPHHITFRIEGKDFSIGRPALYYLLRHAATGRVSAEVVSNATNIATPVYDGVFKFIGANNSLGIDFEYIMSATERSASITLERSFDWLEGKTLIDQAQVNTVRTLTTFTPDYYTGSYYRAPSFGYVQYENPGRIDLFEEQEIISRSLSIKTNSAKNAYDASNVNYLDIMYEVELSKASKANIKSFFEIPDGLKFVIRENDPNGFEEHIFNAGVLSIRRDSTIGDESRSMKIYLEGRVPVPNVTYSASGSEYTYTYSL